MEEADKLAHSTEGESSCRLLAQNFVQYIAGILFYGCCCNCCRFCLKPASVGAYEWSSDITQWPVIYVSSLVIIIIIIILKFIWRHNSVDSEALRSSEYVLYVYFCLCIC